MLLILFCVLFISFGQNVADNFTTTASNANETFAINITTTTAFQTIFRPNKLLNDKKNENNNNLSFTNYQEILEKQQLLQKQQDELQKQQLLLQQQQEQLQKQLEELMQQAQHVKNNVNLNNYSMEKTTNQDTEDTVNAEETTESIQDEEITTEPISENTTTTEEIATETTDDLITTTEEIPTESIDDISTTTEEIETEEIGDTITTTEEIEIQDSTTTTTKSLRNPPMNIFQIGAIRKQKPNHHVLKHEQAIPKGHLQFLFQPQNFGPQRSLKYQTLRQQYQQYVGMMGKHQRNHEYY